MVLHVDVDFIMLHVRGEVVFRTCVVHLTMMFVERKGGTCEHGTTFENTTQRINSC